MIDWQWRELHELTSLEWYAIAAAREAVFVVEQQCPYQELDGWDARASHLIGWEQGRIAAYLRSFAPGVKFAEASLGRILTSGQHRQRGLGRELIGRGLAKIEASHPGAAVRIGAQSRLEQFYRSFGFETVSDPYLEDGIPHIEMLKAATTAK